jgi:thiamine-phosphate diphosphorylase
MNFNEKCLRLYAVTDRSWLSGRRLEDVVEEALRAGVTMVQLREKEMRSEEVLSEALLLRDLCHHYQVPLLIDDDVFVCQKADADGVHIGQDDMKVKRAREILGPDKIIGATAHNVREALQAEADGADYLGCGAAFGTKTKKDAKPMDRNTYRDITSAVHIPVCAIGGISEDNIRELSGLGLDGVAVISGIFASGDIERSCRNLLAVIRDL